MCRPSWTARPAAYLESGLRPKAKSFAFSFSSQSSPIRRDRKEDENRKLPAEKMEKWVEKTETLRFSVEKFISENCSQKFSKSFKILTICKSFNLSELLIFFKFLSFQTLSFKNLSFKLSNFMNFWLNLKFLASEKL